MAHTNRIMLIFIACAICFDICSSQEELQPNLFGDTQHDHQSLGTYVYEYGIIDMFSKPHEARKRLK
mgnify:CR=1 FL=1